MVQSVMVMGPRFWMPPPTPPLPPAPDASAELPATVQPVSVSVPAL